LRWYLYLSFFSKIILLNQTFRQTGSNLASGNVIHQGGPQGAVKMIVVSSANLGQTISRPTTFTMPAGANIAKTVALSTGSKMAVGGSTQILSSGQIYTLPGTNFSYLPSCDQN